MPYKQKIQNRYFIAINSKYKPASVQSGIGYGECKRDLKATRALPVFERIILKRMKTTTVQIGSAASVQSVIWWG